jgi:hypothetical protein
MPTIRTKNIEHRTQNYFIFLCVFSLILFAGCEGKQKAEKQKVENTSVTTTQKEIKDTNSPAKLSAEVERLKKQVESLMGINKEARTAALSTLSAVELSAKTGLYTNEQTKKKDKLVVYLKPIDDMGDVIKAPGAVDIELWNLNAKPESALIGQWQVGPEELKKYWTSSLMSSHYKLQFDLGSKLAGSEKELTLKTQFTDYLTGKVFKSQMVINK